MCFCSPVRIVARPWRQVPHSRLYQPLKKGGRTTALDVDLLYLTLSTLNVPARNMPDIFTTIGTWLGHSFREETRVVKLRKKGGTAERTRMAVPSASTAKRRLSTGGELSDILVAQEISRAKEHAALMFDTGTIGLYHVFSAWVCVSKQVSGRAPTPHAPHAPRSLPLGCLRVPTPAGAQLRLPAPLSTAMRISEGVPTADCVSLHLLVPRATQDGTIKRYLIMNEHVDRETAVAKLLEIQKWIGKGDLVLERLNEPQRPASLFDKMLACESDQGGGDGALGKRLQQEHVERAWEQLGKKVGPRAPPHPSPPCDCGHRTPDGGWSPDAKWRTQALVTWRG